MLECIKSRLNCAEILWYPLLTLILVIIFLQELDLALLGHLVAVVHQILKLYLVGCGLSLLTSFLLLHVELFELFVNLLRIEIGNVQTILVLQADLVL